LGGTSPNGWSGEIVEHYERAGLKERAVPYQVHAGDTARRWYANETAIEYYRRALPYLLDPERGEVMLRLGHVLELVGQWEQAESLFTQALDLAYRLENVSFRAQCEKALGDHLHKRGSDGEALTWLERSKSDFEALDDIKAVGKVIEVMGIIYDLLGDDSRAFAYHQQRLAIAIKLGDRHGVSQAFGNIGLVYWRLGNYERAESFYERQFQVAQGLDDRRGMGRALSHQGMVYYEQGDYARALTCYNQALEIAIQVGDRLARGYVTGHVGRVYHEQGDYVRAMEQYTGQLNIMTALGAQRGISHAVRNIGLLYRDRGDYARARLCFGKSLEIGIEIRDRRIVSYTLANLAAAFDGEGKPEVAERLSLQALALLRSMNMPYYLSEHLYNMAHLNYRLKCYAEAEQRNAEAIEIARRIGRRGIEFRGLVLATLLRLARGQIKKATALRELEALADQWKEDDEQATLSYELARLDETRQMEQRNAAKLYRRLHARTLKLIYRHRYEELTGNRLANPPALPALPENVNWNAVNLELLSKQVEMLVGDAQG
jgi:tetratricopeptide (TPR) repeat protein